MVCLHLLIFVCGPSLSLSLFLSLSLPLSISVPSSSPFHFIWLFLLSYISPYRSGVNFTIILRAAFTPIFLPQRKNEPWTFSTEKLPIRHSFPIWARTMLVKLTASSIIVPWYTWHFETQYFDEKKLQWFLFLCQYFYGQPMKALKICTLYCSFLKSLSWLTETID